MGVNLIDYFFRNVLSASPIEPHHIFFKLVGLKNAVTIPQIGLYGIEPAEILF